MLLVFKAVSTRFREEVELGFLDPVFRLAALAVQMKLTHAPATLSYPNFVRNAHDSGRANAL
ncbi:hypothetical protein PROAA_1240011 [Candidatus Propionivibrio aalborgensis]|uniref:Uncharacterized protein n=1 Tax=Candidatus Propionivibrio aalborgensis TaxID=1860101 RepID=A0A1A8XII8_9RHOO|nr:hypothetical protein PROAA_1240011 [Candidatus Propionivibrio aalborgensis]